MAWSAQGHARKGKAEQLLFSPDREHIEVEDEKAQVEFAEKVVADAVKAGVLDDGKYMVTLNGHANPGNEHDRPSLSISCNPIA